MAATLSWRAAPAGSRLPALSSLIAGFFMRGRMCGMKRKRLLTAILAVATAALVMVIYFAAYVTLSEKIDQGNDHLRIFYAESQVTVFTPAAKTESLCVGHSVNPIYMDPTNPFG